MEALPIELGCEILRYLTVEDLVVFSRSSPEHREIVRGCIRRYGGDLSYSWLQDLPGVTEVQGTVEVSTLEEVREVSRRLRGNLVLRLPEIRRSDLLPLFHLLEVRSTLYPQSTISIEGPHDLLSISAPDTILLYLKTRLIPPLLPTLGMDPLVPLPPTVLQEIDHTLSRLVRGRSRVTVNLGDEISVFTRTIAQLWSQPIRSTGLSRHSMDLDFLSFIFQQNLQEIFGYSLDLEDVPRPRFLYPWLTLNSIITTVGDSHLLSSVRELPGVYIPIEVAERALEFFPLLTTINVYILTTDLLPPQPVEFDDLEPSDQQKIRTYRALHPSITFLLYR